MVGLKTFWITISALFLLGACVPQTKQTECGSNEAFNASLRTCVPVVGGPSSFINISSYVPAFTQTRSKDDATTLAFTVTVANPYNQSYTIEWERVFNAAPVNMCGNALTCTTSANFLGTVLGQIGTHIITAKIKDGNGSLVDTHSFELKVNDLPRPSINAATYFPASYAYDVYPTDPNIVFSFSIKNNNTVMDGLSGYKTTWTIIKNGSTIHSEVDPFTDFALTTHGNNVAYLGTLPSTPLFDPNGPLFGVGSYIIRAVVSNDTPGEVVDEHQWNISVRQPDLANVTNISLPAPGVTVTAHNNIDYNDFPTLSWISGSPATQPNFCVLVDDRDGTYPTDGLSIQVKFYLDGLGGDICTKRTLDTAGTQTICLVDANNCEGSGAPFDTSILRFSNAGPSVTQLHKVTARLFDEATTLEFNQSNVVPSNGSYPIEWGVLVKPTNTAPVMSFGTTNPTGCTASGVNALTGCQVNQGTNFTVSFAVSDDFYSAALNASQFQWDVKLKNNGVDVSSPPTNTTCSKAFGTATTVPAASGPYTTQWTCTIAVPHFTAAGPLHPVSGPYQVVATLQDSGSPVGGAGMISQSLTWGLTVTETNPSGITLSPQTDLLADSHVANGGIVLDPASAASYATERDVVTFRLRVTDNELDNFQYSVSLCTINTPTVCSASTPITSPVYVDFLRALQVTPATNPVLVSGLLYTLPEDLLLQTTPINDVDTATSRLVYFKVDVVDVPSVPLTPVATDSEVFQIYVRNFNPAPVINTATANPAVGSTTIVYSGYPLTIDPGSVTDASGPASERSIVYQWYSDVSGAWTAITGATTRILRYTPGNITTNINLKLCVGDRPLANPVSPTGTCSGTWTVTPKRYLENLSATGSASLQNELAVWYDDTNTVPNTQVIYSAYVDENEDIFVEKTIKNAAGNIVLSTNTIQFEALASGVSNTVSNLSISGSADSLYVAYIASTNSAPSTMVARVRRISKFYDLSAPVQTKTNLAHPAPFGFSYNNYTLTCTSALMVCSTAFSDGIGGAASITFTGRLTVGDTVNINGEVFTAAATPTGSNEICDTSSCANVNAMATNLRDKINNSTLARLHGLTARTNGVDTVQIYGQFRNDYLDFDGSIAGVPGLVAASGGLGKIFVAGGRWHLPMINASLGGAQQNNVTVLSGAADVHLRNVGLSLSTNDTLTEMGKVALFDSKLSSSGELVFARISANLSDSGSISLFRYTLLGTDWSIFDAASSPSATDQSSMPIFGVYSFEDVKLATDAVSNPNFYVLAKEKTINGGEYHIGRYDLNLDSAASVSENFLTTRLEVTDQTSTVISDTLMRSPEIISIPGFAEARIFFHSVGIGSTPYPRIARWKADDTIACGTCATLNGSLEYSSSARIGISQIANNVTLGAAGATANENIKDVVFALFSSDVANDDIFRPQIAIINVESEAIQSTTVQASGMWRPPFVN